MKVEPHKLSVEEYRMIEARQIMNGFVETLDGIEINNEFADIVNEFVNCRGKIITTGMGKAGHAMKKFTSILCSLGFPSVYLHPGEAQHGDLGVISRNDILFVASTSGKTREIIEVIDLARNINVESIIGITSHLDSPIRKKADLIIDMGEIKEAGHLGLAPTSSILVMMALTDCLALVCSKEKGLTKEQYGRFHHGGYLGKKARGK